MHLTECWEVAQSAYRSNGTAGTAPRIGDCVSKWLHKTTTSFHNHEEMEQALVTHAWFGALCFSFSFGGLFMLLLRPGWAKHNDSRSFAYSAFAYWLIFAQGPLAFFADYLYFTKENFVHVIDRFSAIPGVVMELWKLRHMIPHSKLITTVIYSFNLGLALTAFLQSQHYQSEHDVNGFLIWHSIWHLYPLVCSVIMSMDKVLFGDENESKSNTHRDRESDPMLTAGKKIL
jgi:hypothetical protein